MVKSIFSNLKWRGIIADISLAVATLCIAIATCVYIFPGTFLGEAAAFFVPQILLTIVLALVAFIITSAKLNIFLGLGCCLLLLVSFSFYRITLVQTGGATHNTGESLKLMTVNLEHMRRGEGLLKNAIDSHDPDLVVFQETGGTAWIIEKLLADTYPYSFSPPKGFDADITIFSRLPLVNSSRSEISNMPQNPNITKEFVETTVLVGGERLKLFALHPSSPRTWDRLRAREAYMSYIRSHIRRERKASEDNSSLAVVGDWNTSIWSGSSQFTFRHLGLHTRFPSKLPSNTRYFFRPELSSLLGAQVDHIAVSTDLSVSNPKVGPHIDSDHLPLVAEITFPSAKER
ncbi:hypothetical protein E1162_17505 [Rhodobacteraceae bacterium RKSG542]|uniref:endonuclease/exonuclease/phosphatase family protein n=1 Tax=Pseudovibrio flavus TaxID=2529854 RepID=UPI0012BB710D|nr:endonuclease/exonuclease/phosphatase family protein [Pseudovibrio flavus]MTI19042.1 hypothetical protein [Pseudovibrio flavus]